MAAIVAEAEVEQWLEANKSANVKVKKVKEEDNQIELSFGDKYPFTLTFPATYPDSNEGLLAHSESTELSQWNIELMEYCDRKHSIREVLSECARVYNKQFGTSSKRSDRKKDKKSSKHRVKKKEKVDQEDVEDPYLDDIPLVIPEKTKETHKPSVSADKFFTGSGSKTATDRLMKDLQAIMRSDSTQFGYEAGPLDDNLYLWEVKLFGFDPKSDLSKDFEKVQKNEKERYIRLEMKFPNDYPFSPPFIRVVRPRFKFHTGHVTIGGSICMELLTRSGWSPGNDIESILVQIRSEMLSGGARLDLNNKSDYTEKEAQDAFSRVAKQHGWL